MTLKGEGLNETQLHDVGQYSVRNQIAGVPGSAIPPPFGGRLRQIQIYLDPVKMEARQLSLMDVVRTVNDSNLILPAGDVKIGPFDYNLYTNRQLSTMTEINQLPLKMYQGFARPGRRRGQGGGRFGDPDEHRADRRTALGLPPHPQVQCRGQHDRRRATGIKEGRLAPARRAQIARPECRLRPVRLRQDRDQQPDPRGRLSAWCSRAS